MSDFLCLMPDLRCISNPFSPGARPMCPSFPASSLFCSLKRRWRRSLVVGFETNSWPADSKVGHRRGRYRSHDEISWVRMTPTMVSEFFSSDKSFAGARATGDHLRLGAGLQDSANDATTTTTWRSNSKVPILLTRILSVFKRFRSLHRVNACYYIDSVIGTSYRIPLLFFTWQYR